MKTLLLFLISLSTPIDIGDRRELFVDRYLIDKMEGVELRLHRPRPAETVLKFDEPWEGLFCGYVTVLKDNEVYRMYYRGLPDAGKDGSEVETTCYAKSFDGVQWEKPSLGLFEVNGTKENNAILKNAYPHSHNFSPFLDTNPDCDPNERYKALGGIQSSGLHAYVSPDGVHWTHKGEEPVINQGALDSQNVPFWSGSEGCYLCYLRTFTKTESGGVRSISRTTSKDFTSWTNIEQMDFGDTPLEHLYTNQTHPYYRAPHIYVSIAARFFPGKKILTDEQAEGVGIHPNYFGDISDSVFLTSRGGNKYDRTFLEGYIRPGIGWGNWTSRTNYPALGIVETGPAEISIYVQRGYGQPDHHLQRTTLRIDGFVSAHAPYEGGELVTKPLTFSGSNLEINYSTSAAGSVQVEIQDESGNPIQRFTSGDCPPITGDEISRVVSWNNGSDLTALAGKPVRLRFVLKDCDLYSFKFNE